MPIRPPSPPGVRLLDRLHRGHLEAVRLGLGTDLEDPSGVPLGDQRRAVGQEGDRPRGHELRATTDATALAGSSAGLLERTDGVGSRGGPPPSVSSGGPSAQPASRLSAASNVSAAAPMAEARGAETRRGPAATGLRVSGRPVNLAIIRPAPERGDSTIRRGIAAAVGSPRDRVWSRAGPRSPRAGHRAHGRIARRCHGSGG